MLGVEVAVLESDEEGFGRVLEGGTRRYLKMPLAI